MHRQRRQFPLIPDGEPCLQEPVSMRLYENEDLITNIRGPYKIRTTMICCRTMISCQLSLAS